MPRTPELKELLNNKPKPQPKYKKYRQAFIDLVPKHEFWEDVARELNLSYAVTKDYWAKLVKDGLVDPELSKNMKVGNKKSFKKWTDAEDMKVAEMMIEEKKTEEIADATNRTYCSIAQRKTQINRDVKE